MHRWTHTDTCTKTKAHTPTHRHTRTNASLGKLLSYSPSCIAEAIPLSVDKIRDSAILLEEILLLCTLLMHTASGNFDTLFIFGEFYHNRLMKAIKYELRYSIMVYYRLCI